MRRSRVKNLVIPNTFSDFLDQVSKIFLAFEGDPHKVLSKDKYGFVEDVYYLLGVWSIKRSEFISELEKTYPDLIGILDRILYFSLLYLTSRKIEDYRFDISQEVFEKSMRGEVWVKGKLEMGTATFFILNLLNLYHRISQRNPKPFSEVFFEDKSVPDMLKGS